MNVKSIALTITFAALAMALNAVRIPSIFYPDVPFQISQIPIVVAFLLFGARIGVSVGVINMIGALTLFPIGLDGVFLYPMNLLSVLIMFAGLYVASRFVLRDGKLDRSPFWKKPTVGSTALAIAFRGGIMPFFDYATYRFLVPPVYGISLPEAYIVGLVPAFVLYNVAVSIYTVPIAYIVATKVGKYLKIAPHFLKTGQHLRETREFREGFERM
jgi:hypothetical protein